MAAEGKQEQVHGQRQPSGRTPDVDDPTLGLPDQRQERLGHRDLPDHVELKLLAECHERQQLDGAVDTGSGIVHKAVEPRPVDVAGDRVSRLRHRPLVADIERNRNRPRDGVGHLGAGVRRARAGEYAPPKLV